MLYIPGNPEFGVNFDPTPCRAHVGGVRFPKGAQAIHGRLSPAIHGLRNFWEADPTNALETPCKCPHQTAYSIVRGAASGPPPKNVRSHGWRSPSVTRTCRRSVFWEGALKPLPAPQQEVKSKGVHSGSKRTEGIPDNRRPGFLLGSRRSAAPDTAGYQ